MIKLLNAVEIVKFLLLFFRFELNKFNDLEKFVYKRGFFKVHY